jgi:hypothetical protein
MSMPKKTRVLTCNPHADEEITSQALVERVFRPLLLHLYEHAELDIPKEFLIEVEGPRLVAALRTQGFNAVFPVGRG